MILTDDPADLRLVRYYRRARDTDHDKMRAAMDRTLTVVPLEFAAIFPYGAIRKFRVA
jgi:hypothetical protein